MSDGSRTTAGPSAGPPRPGQRDIVLGVILLIFGLAWTITVDRVVPAGRGFGVGPRAFPFWLGVGLCVLSALLIGTGLLDRWRQVERPPETAPDEDAAAPATGWLLLRVLVSVAGVIAFYGYLMPRLGFLLATALVVAGTLVLILNERRWLLVLGMAAGLSAGSWLVFGKLLGAYMPRGSWVGFF